MRPVRPAAFAVVTKAGQVYGAFNGRDAERKARRWAELHLPSTTWYVFPYRRLASWERAVFDLDDDDDD